VKQLAAIGGYDFILMSGRSTDQITSPKLSDINIDKVALLRITLAGSLGGILNPFKSSLTNSRSHSLIMHG